MSVVLFGNVSSSPTQPEDLARSVNSEGGECGQTLPDYTQMFLTVTLGVLDKCTAPAKWRGGKQCRGKSGKAYLLACFCVCFRAYLLACVIYLLSDVLPASLTHRLTECLADC